VLIIHGPPQIRRGGDNNIGNFLVATVRRLGKTRRMLLTFCHTDTETWKRLLLPTSLSTYDFSRNGVGFAK
jgi:hypothetical protein